MQLFRTQQDPTGDVDPEIYLAEKHEGSRLQILTCFPQFLPGTGWKLQNTEKACLEVIWADNET